MPFSITIAVAETPFAAMRQRDLRFIAATLVCWVLLLVNQLELSGPSAAGTQRLTAQGSLLVVNAGDRSVSLTGGNPPEATAPHLAPFVFAPICVNLADSQLLQSLPGIGPALAERIIAYRTRSGPITDIAAFTAVPGIGAGRAQLLAEQLCFDTNDE